MANTLIRDTKRMVDLGSNSPALDTVPLTWMANDVRMCTDPAGVLFPANTGIIEWVCTVAGTPGTWVPVYGVGGAPISLTNRSIVVSGGGSVLTEDNPNFIIDIVNHRMVIGTGGTYTPAAGAPLTVLNASGGVSISLAGAITQGIWKTGGIFNVGTLDAQPFQVGTNGGLRAAWDSTGNLTLTPGVVAGPTVEGFRFTAPAHTAATAWVADFLIDNSRTLGLAAGGTIAVWRAMSTSGPTFTAPSARTISVAATLAISGPPGIGANVTITQPLALWVEAGDSYLNGNLTVAFLGGGTVAMVKANTGGLLQRAVAGTDYAVSVAAGTNISVSNASGVYTVNAKDATYWVSSSTNIPASGVNLGALSTGLVKITVSAGVATPSTAVSGTDYVAPWSLTSRSIVISAGGASLTEDNNNFVVDTTNHRMIIAKGGAYTPAGGAPLTISGSSAGISIVLDASGAQSISKSGSGDLSIGTTIASNLTIATNSVTAAKWDTSQNTLLTPSVVAGPTVEGFHFTAPASTAYAGAVSDFLIDNSRTIALAAGATIATWRSMNVSGPTFTAPSARTISVAATLSITNAPNVGTNVTITQPLALWVENGDSYFSGRIASGVLVGSSVLVKCDSGGGNLARAVPGTDYAVSLTAGTNITVSNASGVWTVNSTAGGITQLTGDVIAGPGSGSQVATLKNIPNDTPAAGDILFTASGAPANPSAGLVKVFADSTNFQLRTINSFGSTSSTAFNTPAVASNWLRSFSSVSGAFTASQPTVGDISGIPSLTQGSVIFAGPSNTFAQDNSNFYWDDTNNRLVIAKGGAFSPAAGAPLTVSGASGGVAINLDASTAQSIVKGGTGALSIGTTTATSVSMLTNGTTAAQWDSSQNLTLTPGAVSGGITCFTISGAAHSGVNTDYHDIQFNMSRTVALAAGATISTMSSWVFSPPVFTAPSSRTITVASSFSVSGTPAAGTNVTITQPLAFWVQNGDSYFNGRIASGVLVGTSVLVKCDSGGGNLARATPGTDYAVSLVAGTNVTVSNSSGVWTVNSTSTSGITQLTGDGTAGPGSGSQVFTLVNIPTGTTAAGTILWSGISAPATPAAGKSLVYLDSSTLNICGKNGSGFVQHMVQTQAAVAGSFLKSCSDSGTWTTGEAYDLTLPFTFDASGVSVNDHKLLGSAATAKLDFPVFVIPQSYTKMRLMVYIISLSITSVTTVKLAVEKGSSGAYPGTYAPGTSIITMTSGSTNTKLDSGVITVSFAAGDTITVFLDGITTGAGQVTGQFAGELTLWS